jgi:ADP-heptose:LPS heptosyltransferase
LSAITKIQRRVVDSFRGQNSAVANIREGEAALKRGQPLVAERHFQVAHTLWPADLRVASMLAESIRQSGDMERAEEFLAPFVKKYINADPQNMTNSNPGDAEAVAMAMRVFALTKRDMGKIGEAELYSEQNTRWAGGTVESKLSLQHLREVKESGTQLVRISARVPAGKSAVLHNKAYWSEEVLQQSFFLSDSPDNQHQCVCYSPVVTPTTDIEGEEGFVCGICGTATTARTTVVNKYGVVGALMSSKITASDIEKLLERIGRNTIESQVAILDNQNSNLGPEIIQIPISSNGFKIGGAQKLSFDVVFLPHASYRISDLRRVLKECFELLKPNGHLVVGFVAPFVDFTEFSIKAAKRWNEMPSSFSSASGEKSGGFVFPTSQALRGLADELVGESDNRAQVLGAGRNRVLVIQKSAVIKAGIMSGIGDAVWSLVLAKAMMKRYGVKAIDLIVHDSADHRRKRSNALLERFGFVRNVEGARFDVHAAPPMNDRTGHINYVASGPAPLQRNEPFDYRLIFNTYLEHGDSYQEICEKYGLDKADINYDFWNEYREEPEDLGGMDRLRSQLGNEFIVVHFGAKSDNTEVGLNRGGIWSKKDWIELCDGLYKKYNLKIVVVGAAYDLEYAREVLNETRADYFVNTIGQLDIVETIALMKRARFIVSFPSGIGIIGPYMGVKTLIFWRPQHLPYHPLHENSGFHKGFATNWVPPSVLKSKAYIDAWYSIDTPKTILQEITSRKW